MKKTPVKKNKEELETEFPGYPLYPASEDIYNKATKDTSVHPGEEELIIEPDNSARWNEKGIDDATTGDDLDVPGSELDDANELTGDEDEENNYYSLGGDNHDN